MAWEHQVPRLSSLVPSLGGSSWETSLCTPDPGWEAKSNGAAWMGAGCKERGRKNKKTGAWDSHRLVSVALTHWHGVARGS